MIHIYSSKVLLNMSITLISIFYILPYMIYLRSIVKILLPIMDLNIAYKTHKTSKNTRNSDFRKTREIRFWCYISRSSAPYAFFFPLSTPFIYSFRPEQPQSPSPRATHISPARRKSHRAFTSSLILLRVTLMPSTKSPPLRIVAALLAAALYAYRRRVSNMLLTLTESSLSTFTGNSPTTSTTSTTSSAPPPHSSHPSATSVLAFWFPPNVPSSTLRKTLWMPLTPQLRALADEKVERFRPLIMKILHDENFRRSWFQTARTLLALIVACDQFPRHFARSEAPLSDAEALLASAIAMEACTSLRNLNDGEALEELSGQQLCFCLMPMRHEGNLESIKLVESIVRRREEKVRSSPVAYLVFSSSRSLTVACKSLSPRTQMAEEVETLCNFKKATVRRRRAAEDLTRHHAVNVETFDAHDLLDGIDVDNPDMSDVEKTKICKDMVAWLSRERGDIHGGDNRTKVWGGGAKWKRRNGRINAAPGSTSSSRLSSPPAIQRNLRLLVSLSGGVDSMVIAHCLHHLTSRFNVELTCCHVDYGNR